MARTGIALGSNLGDRAANLRAAYDRLGSLASAATPILAAHLYETAPVGCPPDSPAFLNTVIEIDWSGTALGLLEKTRAIETQLGRTTNPVRNAPRVIDIDLLYCGQCAVVHPDLTLPHPRMWERLFVLMPLADIRPDFFSEAGAHGISTFIAGRSTNEPPPKKIRHARWSEIVTP